MEVITKAKIVKTLTDWNKHAEELFKLDIINKLKSTVNLNYNNGNLTVTSTFPSDESIKACINDIRRFFQSNDTLKIHKLIDIYKSKLILDCDKISFNENISYIDKVNSLDSAITLNKKTFTRKEIFDTFVYGKISHRTKDIKDIYDKWESDPILFPLLKTEFLTQLEDYITIINNLLIINKKVIVFLS